MNRPTTQERRFAEHLASLAGREDGDARAALAALRRGLGKEPGEAADLLVRTRPDLTIRRLLHDRDLRRRPVRVPLPGGASATVIPDAFLQLHEAAPAGAGYWHDVVWELDMGTADQATWRRKVRALVAYALGPYREALGAAAITIAVLTPAGWRIQKRVCVQTIMVGQLPQGYSIPE